MAMNKGVRATLDRVKVSTNSGTYTGPGLGTLIGEATEEDRYLSINPQADSYQLIPTDNGKMIDMDKATPNNLVVPLNSTAPFPVGTQVIVRQVGAGQTTIVGDVGVTFHSKDGLKVSGQYGLATLIKVAVNTWAATGALTA